MLQNLIFDWLPSNAMGILPSMPAIATSPPAETGSFILTAVLLSLASVYIVSKLGGELSKRFDLPPVLGELVGGVVVGFSATLFGLPRNGSNG